MKIGFRHLLYFAKVCNLKINNEMKINGKLKINNECKKKCYNRSKHDLRFKCKAKRQTMRGPLDY